MTTRPKEVSKRASKSDQKRVKNTTSDVINKLKRRATYLVKFRDSRAEINQLRRQIYIATCEFKSER